MKNQHSSIVLWTTLIYFILAFYIYGATVVEVFVYYPSWEHIHDDWTAFKQGIDSRLIPLYVVPTFLLFIPLVMMLWYRFPTISWWAIWVQIILFSIPAIATFIIQLPIQMQLAEGWNPELYDTLMKKRWPTRQLWALLSFLFNGWLLYQVLKSKTHA